MTPPGKAEECFKCDYLENRKYVLEKISEVGAATLRIEEKLDESIQRMQDVIDRLEARVNGNREEISKLGIKAGILSTLAGFVALVGLVIWEWIRGGGGHK